MELSILKKEVTELNEMLAGGFIAKVYQPLPREIVIKIRLATFGEKRLILSADPALGRIHTTSLRIPNPPSPPRFCSYLRAHLQGSRIQSIEAPLNDRVVVIKCVRGQKESLEKRLLILEIMGRDSNIILVRETDGSIMECLHRIYTKQEHCRSVIPGVTYQYPPPNPRMSTRETGDLLATEIDQNIMPERPKEKHQFPASDQSNNYSNPGLDKALDSHFASILGNEILESFRRSIRAPLNHKIKSLRKRLGKIEEDKNRLHRFALEQKFGELVKFNLKKIEKGMTSIDVLDWETNTTKTIQLDPSLTPVGNMESYFRKSSKARRGFSIVQERLKTTNDEIEALQDMEYLVSEAISVPELEQLGDEIKSITNVRSSSVTKKVKKKQVNEGQPFIEYKSPSGHKIMVGKSARGNDLILRQIANKNDLWLHVRELAGAHVFLVSGGISPINDDDIGFAANLALKHSKGKNDGKKEVMVAYVKDVARLKGASLGQVRIRNFYTVVGHSSDEF